MIPKYGFKLVQEFDAKVRQEVARGIRKSWNPVPIQQDFYMVNGMWVAETANTKPVKDRDPEKDYGKGGKKTCRDYNSAKGCTHPKCKFQHKCSKCGGKHSATTCTKT